MLEEALDRMPHRGAMRLIGSIEKADDAMIRCIARDHFDGDYPLRLNGVLYASALVELGAQAAAAHASLYGLGAAHTGLVLSIGAVEFHRNEVPDNGNLQIVAQRLRALGMAASYHFSVGLHGAPITSGEVLLSIVGKDA